MTAPQVYLGEACWLSLSGAVAIVVARRAEARRSPARAPLPWVSALWVLALACVAPMVPPAPASAARALACIALAAVAGPDARTGLIFDAITFPTAAVLVAFAIACRTTGSALHGVLLLCGSFGFAFLYSRGRLIGLGDIKAMFAIGVAFGPFESLVAIFAASLCGIATAAAGRSLRRGRAIAFGPHLAFGAGVAFVAGNATAVWLGVS